MPIQKTDRDTQWNIEASNQTWTLAKGATITVENQYGISENGFFGSDIRVLGNINITGELAGVHLTGSGSSVFIGNDARINAQRAELGILSEGADFEIINHGRILVGDTAVFSSMSGSVDNYGTIRGGDNAVFISAPGGQVRNFGRFESEGNGLNVDAGGTHIENAKDAEISGNYCGISISGAGSSELVNRGVVRSDGGPAIHAGSGDATILNTGNIIGDVSLGEGNDVVDTRKGILKGTIEGGAGSDTFLISDAKIEIVEVDYDSSIDEVLSTVSYELGANIETIRLLRKADVDATGNELDNTVRGNKGDNHLTGKAGEDFLTGNRGGDTLTGGTEADVFIFGRVDGADVINDFEDGIDRLYIDGVYDEATFDTLNIRQAKDDLVIDFGGAHEIRIENLAKADFTFDDIILLA